jgi:hypothetical protein
MVTRRLVEVVEELGITYRQADYWARQGYIHTSKVSTKLPDDQLMRRRRRSPLPVTEESGSGTARALEPHEVDVLRVMVQLVSLTISPPMAAELARRLVDNPGCAVQHHGVYITHSGE